MDFLDLLSVIGNGVKQGRERRRQEEEDRQRLEDQRWQDEARNRQRLEWVRADKLRPEMERYEAAKRADDLMKYQAEAEAYKREKEARALKSAFGPVPFGENDAGTMQTIATPQPARNEMASIASIMGGGVGGAAPSLAQAVKIGMQGLVQPYQSGANDPMGVTKPTEAAQKAAMELQLFKDKNAAETAEIDKRINAGLKADPTKPRPTNGRSSGAAKSFRMTEQQKKEFEAEVSKRVSAEIGDNSYMPPAQIDAIKKKHAWNVYREKFGGGNSPQGDKSGYFNDIGTSLAPIHAQLEEMKRQRGGQQ